MNTDRLMSQYLLVITVFPLLLSRYFRLFYETVPNPIFPDIPELSYGFPLIQREATELYPGTGGLYV